MEGEHYSMSNVAVYAKGSTDFTTQGLGILADVLSSKTTQTVSDGGNVTSQLELEYPVKGRLVDNLVEGNFIRVSMATDSSKYMVYEISDTLKDDSGIITVYADPYSDRIGRMSFENGGKFGSYNSVQAALNYAKSQMKDFPSSFQLVSNISKSVDFTKDGIIPNFKKFLDLLNSKVSGNVYYGLNIIQIYSALGKDRSDIILRDDRNTSSVKVKTDYSSIINRIIPVLPVLDKDGNATQETKVGTPVNSKTPNQFLDYWSAEAIQLDNQDLANTYFDRTHADRPVQTVDVDPLSMSEDFSDIDIFDRVQIYSSRLNYTDTLRVSSRVVDNLTGQVTKFSLGSASVSIYNTIEGQTQSVLNQIQAITSVVISASGKNQIFTSNVQPTSANEGDMWIQEDGDYQAFWVYKNGDWVRLVDSDTQKTITDGVNSAIEQAKLDAQGIVDSNNTVIRAEMQTVATQKAQDEIAKGSFDANAQAYATAAKTAAISQAQSLVSTQAQQAAKDLSDARLSIQNDINITNGNVKSLTDRADGWDATVVKVNGLSTGDRNYILDTAKPKTQPAYGKDNQDFYDSAKFYSPIKNWGIANGDYVISFDWTLKTELSSDMQASVFFNQSPWQEQKFTVPAGQLKGHVDLKFKLTPGLLTATNDVTGLTFRIHSQMASGNAITYSNLFMKSGTISTTWTPAPEDVSAASAQAQLTADKAALDLKNYQVTNDGSVKKAQSDITVLAGKVETKVSQVDYDSNNNTLNQNISTATQTATQAQTTINNYKTTTDGKLQTMSGQIDTVAGSVALAATKIELNNAKSEFSSQVSSVKADYDSVTQSVSEVKGTLNDLQQVNLITNSDMNPDLSGWHLNNPWGTWDVSKYLKYDPSSSVNSSSASFYIHDYTLGEHNVDWLHSDPILASPGTTYTASLKFKMPDKTGSNVPLALYIRFYDVNKTVIASRGYNVPLADISTEYKKFNYTTTAPDGTYWVSYVLGWNSGPAVYFGEPMLVVGSTVGNYVRGKYSNNDKIALQQITINSISSIVSDPTTGLSTRVQTAEGFLTQVRGTDIPALQKATFWQPYSSLNFNDYTKQGSFFFNTTSAKTNGPVSGNNSWTYLMVEEGMGSARIKQTAWYDGVNGVKITYVRTLNSGTWSPWYANDNDSVATISTMNGQITQEISDRKTGDSNTLSQSKDYTTSQINSAVSGVNSTITQTASAVLASVESTNLVINSEFDPLNGTFYRLTDGTATGSQLAEAWNAPQASSFSDWPVVNGSRVISYTAVTWYSTALVVAGAGNAYSASIVAGRNPAPTASTALDLRIGWFDSDKKIIGATSAGNIIDGTSQKPIQKYVIENRIAPAGTRYISLIIAHSASSAIDFITRPSLNFGTTAAPYIPTYGTEQTSTILSLLKNNWSIGIADNIGNIVSGIAGNSSQMAIISDKVIIKSPNTQITGTAWIKTAMIADGQIGTSQIGDASITSAKILSLDVGKISGNISNFVKSAWDDAYGSNVAIDGVGMVVSYGNTSTAFTNGNVLFKQLANYADGSNQVETIGSISTTHNGTVNNIVIGLYDQTHIPFGSTDGKKIGSPTGEIYGGDLIAFGKARDFNGNFDHIFSYSNQTASLKYGISEGFNFRDKVNFNSNEIVTGSVNYNLKIGALKFSGKFDGRYVPVIVATWSGYLGGGIAFGGDNVLVFNQSKANIL